MCVEHTAKIIYVHECKVQITYMPMYVILHVLQIWIESSFILLQGCTCIYNIICTISVHTTGIYNRIHVYIPLAKMTIVANIYQVTL